MSIPNLSCWADDVLLALVCLSPEGAGIGVSAFKASPYHNRLPTGESEPFIMTSATYSQWFSSEQKENNNNNTGFTVNQILSYNRCDIHSPPTRKIALQPIEQNKVSI